MIEDAGFYEQEAWGETRTLDPAVYVPRVSGTADLFPREPAPWLDVGSGDGRFTFDLADRLGVPDHVMVAERSLAALAHNPLTAVAASAIALPFADRSFRTVSAFEMIEHLPVGIFEAALTELARVSDGHVIVTVPNQEKTHRSNVRCPQCGCQYNPARHLRTFHPDRLEGLIPGFQLTAVAEFGHRAYLYPRVLRIGLERIGLLERVGWPACPQCGLQLSSHEGNPPAAPVAPAESGAAPGRPTLGQRGYRLARRFSPRERHTYFLGARFDRV